MTDYRLDAAVSFYLESTPRAAGGSCYIPVAWPHPTLTFSGHGVGSGHTAAGVLAFYHSPAITFI